MRVLTRALGEPCVHLGSSQELCCWSGEAVEPNLIPSAWPLTVWVTWGADLAKVELRAAGRSLMRGGCRAEILKSLRSKSPASAQALVLTHHNNESLKRTGEKSQPQTHPPTIIFRDSLDRTPVVAVSGTMWKGLRQEPGR